MEFYYGLPQEIWDDILIGAEDLLQEEELGQHLVGVYPAGGRIYGIESYPPGLMCLYIGDVESLIDPTSSYHKELGFRVFNIMNGHSPIYMVDFFKWVRWITTEQTNDMRMQEFLHLIPFGQHVIHEDNAITPILHSIHSLLKSQNFKLCGDGPIRNDSKLLSYPFIRAYNGMIRTGKFMPCLKPKWDDFLTCEEVWGDSELQNFDDQFRSQLLKNEPLPRVDKSIIEIYPCSKRKDLMITKSIRSQVIDLYRYQL